MSESVFIGLGSNVGDRVGQLCAAVATLSRIDAVGVVRCSSLFESAPLGPPQPHFLNADVLKYVNSLAPATLNCARHDGW